MDQKFEIITGGKIGSLNGLARFLIFFLVLVGLGLTIYAEAFYALFINVIQRHDSSHGLFVPFISGYFIWLKLDKIKGIKPHIALLPGGTTMMAGLILFYLGRSGTGFSLPVLSFLLVAGGLVLVLFGRDMFKEVGFPLFFLASMIPLPTAVYSQMAEWMRQVTTWGAVALLKPFGIPIHCDGFDIYLRDIRLYVDHGCSGIRVLISYFVFGLAYAVRYKQSNKARLLVVAAALPLSITHNIARLFILFISVDYIGPVLSVEHRYHVLFSWSLFTALLVGAIGLDCYLARFKVRKE